MQEKPVLPLYSTDRIGNKIGIFNIQYFGSLKDLETKLASVGWNKKKSSVFYSLMIRIDGKHSETKLPIMEQLYLNKRPELIMINSSNKDGRLYILRLWRSNYKINDAIYPLWIGSIILATNLENEVAKNDTNMDAENCLFVPLLQSLKKYRIIDLKIHRHNKNLRRLTNPKLLIFEI